jgi:hypothetical protein
MRKQQQQQRKQLSQLSNQNQILNQTSSRSESTVGVFATVG